MNKAIFAAIAFVAVLSFAVTSAWDGDVSYEKTLARQIKYASFITHRDANFNTAIRIPGFFVAEADTSSVAYSYARYACYPPKSFVNAAGQVVIEYSATVCRDNGKSTCATDSTVQDDDYVTFLKSVYRQKMKFTYSLTYPAAYEESVSRLKNEVRCWQPFLNDSPKPKAYEHPRRQRAKIYHSGFANE